ncbi:LPXTG cell wall anchor domain-containing protein [Streptomyces glomeratus]|uniref:Gram-positive cocci surface proteins LPxTG domain-containing protein n=1 Tax=Streptomyces glomeratus TaxID=284452 RepID=A0ABP6L526_9ACTN|nr:LPXTG cell wall anchor domain-containing protein [Streptomyces glomeratus]MCF1507333.1 LPXTG cell wall anchor domain-containing protein [Streptomyces glomeratus]
MKLRHAIATAVASAAMTPLALLSAPTAFADDAPPTTSATETAATETPTSPAPATDSTTTPAGGESSTSTSSAPTSGAPAGKPTSSATASGTPTGSQTPSSRPTDPSDGWSPDQCDEFNLDQNLKITVKGLPNKIVAGSGWHNFTFSVKNDSDTDLKNVWVNTFTEYADNESDDSLAFDLAQLQYKDPETGKWTDSYQDGEGDTVFSGTFVGVIDAIDKGAKVDMDLRVRVSAKAPAGSSFAMSSAIYAGKGTACNGNGDSYEFTVLAAGTKPTDSGDAKPTGDKPTGKPKTDMKPQGGSEQLPVTGKLASTGSSSMLPVIGLVGGVAVVAGAGVVFAVRRRKAGAQAAA